ncbi:MAG: hypothetical protein IT159_14375 [Bryobacterales bacterium]|nr:hypothetical protein [Bryobacterales bacterium]
MTSQKRIQANRRNALAKLGRYQFGLERALFRSIREIERLQARPGIPPAP